MQVSSYAVNVSTHRAGKPRTHPIWVGRWTIDGHESKKTLGKAHVGRGRPPQGFMSEAEAERALEAHLIELKLQETAAQGMTFGAVADAWLRELKRRVAEESFKAASLRTYYNILNHAFRSRWQDVAIEAIPAQEIRALFRSMREEGKRPTTMNQHRAVLRGIFKLATREYKLTLSQEVWEAWEWVVTKRQKSGGLTFYTPEEARRLVAHAADAQEAAILMTAAFTGLRVGELLALRWRNVDFANSTIRVVKGFTEPFLLGGERFGGEGSPKSWGERSMPMMAEVARTLARLREREQWTGDEDLVFPDQLGSNWDHSKLYRAFKATARRAGLREIRLHDLRHSFGTMAISAATIVEVQEWMGHADIQTTRRYLHYAPRADAADRLQAVANAGSAPVVPLRAVAQ